MAGISHVLNIAKEALLSHQLSVQVASHNISNVDTPGYTRQTLGLTTNLATPLSVGNVGGGVRGESIEREYDQFMTKRIVNQNSTLGNLEAQQESLRVVETIFNETPGMALNDLFSQFWASWQDLADNPEILATRQAVVQQGQLIYEQLQAMNAEIAQTKYDIGMSLDTAVSDVNALTRQIADLNVSIASSEGKNKQANDLRDQRDELVKELSQLLDINYFENKSGSYTVLLSDGHALVDTNEAWQVEWSNNTLYWLGSTNDGRQVRSDLGDGMELGGKIGGWLEVRGELVENDPNNFLGRLDALANALIREVNQQHSQGVGMLLFDTELTGSETAANTAELTTTVDAATSLTTIEAGIFEINDRAVGKIEGGALNNGLAMRKAANAAEAINQALTGVTAKLTTLVAGSAVTGVGAAPANDGAAISFTINGVDITYTVDNDGAAPDDSDPATFADNLVAQIKADLAAYNADPTHVPKITIDAKRGTGTNGGPLNSIVLFNTMPGDESRIVIDGIDAGLEANLGLTAGTYTADPSHNTGQLTLFGDEPFTVKAGTNDMYLEQLGMDGGLHPEDEPNDGEFTYSYDINGTAASLQGYKYAGELQTDGGSFDLWLYNADGSLALPQPVTVPLERAYTLQNVADSINTAISNAGGQASWLQASVVQNQLVLKPDDSHQFAFANDTSNFLQVAGLNTFFTGYSAGSLGINEVVEKNLNLIAAGTVSDRGEIFRGDNSNALLVTDIQRDEHVRFTGSSTDTLDGFYNSLVAEIGSQGRSVKRDYEYNVLITNQMSELRDAVSGVSLDEEMANLVKFQHAYSAAARLVSTSDEMLQTLLNAVQR